MAAARFAKLNRCGPDLENQSIDALRLISYTCSCNGKEKRRRLEQIGQRLERRIGKKCAVAEGGLSWRHKQRQRQRQRWAQDWRLDCGSEWEEGGREGREGKGSGGRGQPRPQKRPLRLAAADLGDDGFSPEASK